MRKILFLLVCLSSSSGFGQAKEGFDYPELLVVPLASQRLADEAKKEEQKAWSIHAPVQISALATIFAGTQVMGDKKKGGDLSDAHYAGLAATVIGSGWLLTTIGMSAAYRPYGSGHSEIKKMPSKSREDKLYRERIAEERIQAPAQIAGAIKWGSVLSNFAASVAVLASAEEDVAKVYGGVSAILSLGPLFFDYGWRTVYQNQENYKKRIYGPLSVLPATMRDPQTSAVFRGVSVAFTL
ncbi:MAG: hypothetical protein AB7T49_07280 [Oligoflexales bacterium]